MEMFTSLIDSFGPAGAVALVAALFQTRRNIMLNDYIREQHTETISKVVGVLHQATDVLKESNETHRTMAELLK